MANLIGSPVTFTTSAFTEDSSLTYAFHRLYLVITAGSLTMTNSTAVESGESVQFDISSALQAAFDSYEYSPISATMTRPSISFTVKKYEQYMVDGVVERHPTSGETAVGSGTAYPGKYSDLQRYQNDSSDPSARLSLKPTTGEIVKKDSVVSIGGTVYSAATLGAYTDNMFYVVEDDEMYEMQFVNSLGMVESICARCLPEESFDVEEDEYTRTYGVGFSDVNRFVNKKTAQRFAYAMSSGPVNREWQQWWMKEFCMADKAWIKIDGSWIPCSVALDKGGDGRNKSKTDVLSCEFTVKLNIEGI